MRVQLGEAKTPEGVRLYAVGDVHGCDALLADVHHLIAQDIARHPTDDHRIIHVGDYCDRGPDSAGVIDRLVKLSAEDERVVCLLGNHDLMMLDFLTDPVSGGPDFVGNGGDTTLRSYGVQPGSRGPGEDYAALSRALAEAMPVEHKRFLDALEPSARFGDYFFCHAGIRPGVPLDRQDAHDLVWIREEFLLDDRDHGVVVIHGHTPSDPDKLRPNRINIDTGAAYGGPLTCLVLEGTSHRIL